MGENCPVKRRPKKSLITTAVSRMAPNSTNYDIGADEEPSQATTPTAPTPGETTQAYYKNCYGIGYGDLMLSYDHIVADDIYFAPFPEFTDQHGGGVMMNWMAKAVKQAPFAITPKSVSGFFVLFLLLFLLAY